MFFQSKLLKIRWKDIAKRSGTRQTCYCAPWINVAELAIWSWACSLSLHSSICESFLIGRRLLLCRFDSWWLITYEFDCRVQSDLLRMMKARNGKWECSKPFGLAIALLLNRMVSVANDMNHEFSAANSAQNDPQRPPRNRQKVDVSTPSSKSVSSNRSTLENNKVFTVFTWY